MHTVVIVDDEYYFRQTLKKYIQSYGEEFEIVGEAFNGIAGIELVNQLEPDIALLDISMPQKDGFDVINGTRLRSRKTRFIIISGYDRFEYAQKSIKLGVVDFLLKPITSAELYECLRKVAGEIDYERNLAATLKDLTQKESRRKDYLVFTFFQKLISSNSSYDALHQLANDIGFKIDNSYFASAIVRISSKESPLDNKTLELFVFEISKTLNELLSSQDIQCICSSDGKQILVLLSIPLENRNNGYNLKHTLEYPVSTLIKKQNHLSIIAAANSFCLNIEELHSVFSSLQKLQEYCGFYCIEGIFEYKEFEERLLSVLPPDSFKNNRMLIIKALQDNNYAEIIRSCQPIFDMVMRLKPAPESFLEQFRPLISDISHIITEYNLQQLASPAAELMTENRTFKDIRNAFLELINSISRELADPVQPSSHITVIKIRNYIKEHYSDPGICSYSLSEVFNLNEQHLCFLFRKYTNTTIGNYILNIRMQAAKHLLEEENLNISEVSESVGYNDAGYFSKCFKKYYGIAPKHYVTRADKHSDLFKE